MGFQEVKSKIVYATDTWMTPQMVYSFACLVACFINDDWELIEHVIDLKIRNMKACMVERLLWRALAKLEVSTR